VQALRSRPTPPRLQAVATRRATGPVRLPHSLSNLDQVYGNFYGRGFATIVPDALFDFSERITQSTTLPGFGSQNLSTLPRADPAISHQCVPLLQKVVRRARRHRVAQPLQLVELWRQHHARDGFAVGPGDPVFSNLSSGTLHEGSFIAATGQDFQRVQVRFTADASEFNTPSTAQNTQISVFNDLEYRFTATIAALGRAG
jgi:hypothetical protein